jgi:3-deoxy-manno-octulosonate cytidylyltransferase (CMP-KDO synthetase)
MNPIVLIPARLASTRLPQKPLADIAGEPMIAHVWRRAIRADIGPVYVACDDGRIAAAVERAGGKAVMTRPDHPSGSDRIFEALSIIDPDKRYDTVVNVQGDVPTIEPETIRAVLKPLELPVTDIATLACIIKDDRERTDPAVVKPVFTAWHHGNIRGALFFTRDWAPIPPHNEIPYHHIGIYAYRRPALERFVSLPPSPLELKEKLEQLRALENGMRIDVALVNSVPLGVDTPEHLERARKALSA